MDENEFWEIVEEKASSQVDGVVAASSANKGGDSGRKPMKRPAKTPATKAMRAIISAARARRGTAR
jgi:hypothetical protein